MKLKDQVCSLELAKELKALGVKWESAFYWAHLGKVTLGPMDLNMKLALKEHLPQRYEESDVCSAFTVAELFNRLPHQTTVNKYLSKGTDIRFCCVEYITIENHAIHDESLPDCIAKMWIHLIEKGIMKP